MVIEIIVRRLSIDSRGDMIATVNITRATWQNSVASERLFFLIMAIVIAVTVIFGFTVNAARMHWTFFSLPWHVHLHAGVF